MTAPNWTGALKRAEAHSPFLSRALARRKDLAAMLAEGQGEEALALARMAGEGVEDVAVGLRRERLALAAVLGIGDLAGVFPLTRVMAELSDFADRAMDAAIRDAILARVPDAEPAGFIALALGKHGARELNYSSDIDPILLYDPLLLPRRERDDPGEAAQRVARRMVETLSMVTGEGYVFRVDLRLRPASEVSPLAIPIDAALTHYESEALAWERAAFIRARACAGDIAAGEEFLAAIRPFVWRRSLDFGAVEEIGRLTAQIRATQEGAERPGPGFDVKRGHGGIREVEFFAQTHQLIHGGRRASLRLRGTRASLDALAQEGLIAADDAQVLGESYDRLRQIEHRLQMIADQQTHSIPADPAALDAVARLDGLASGAVLIAEIEQVTAQVALRYDALIAANAGGEQPPPSALAGAALASQLGELGFSDAKRLAKRIEGWTSGTVRALRSDAAQSAFAAVMPQLLRALGLAPDPDRAMLRWEQLLANLPSAVNLFHLLEARPALLQLLADVLALAPPLADELARRPGLLDPLIDASALDLPASAAALAGQFSHGESGDDYERLLDRVRRMVGELRFALGVQLIEAAHDPLDVSAGLARVAEAAIGVLAEASMAEFAKVHGRIAGSEFVVLGLGRLGGGALTHASDLDLVYLFTGSTDAESDGARPLGATLYYNRLAQRVSAALSVPTAEGALYEVDTRLRPSGGKGPLAVSFESFAHYQQAEAWTWEHMALARARPVHGPAQACAALERIVADVLTAKRDPAKLRADVLEMRGTMAGSKPPKGPLDVKLMRGGLVDVEFLVHFLQLRGGKGLTPHLGDAVRELVAAGLLPPGLAQAHDALARLLIAARLLAPDSDLPPPASRAALAKACQCGDWEQLLARLAQARTAVASAWRDIFGETLEIEP